MKIILIPSLSSILFMAVAYARSVPGETEESNVPPPARLRTPMRTAFRQISSGGPLAPYPRAKDALNLPLLSMNEPWADSILSDIKAGIQYVFQTRNDLTLALHGTGTTATQAVLDNLIEPGDKVMVGVIGYWGDVMANISARLGAHVIRYEKSPGSRFTLSEIELALRVYRPQLLVLVNGESSTTVYQPLDGIGDLCERYGVLIVVDAVVVAGIQPVMMDRRKLDAVFTSSHKGIGAAAGLAPVSLSARAMAKIKLRKIPPRAIQTDLTLQAQLWNTAEPDRIRAQSLSMPLLYSLREALATISSEGLENVQNRHVMANDQLNRGLTALGLEHAIPNPDFRLLGLTSFKVPYGKDPYLIADYVFENYNIEISTGFGPTAGQVLRFATFTTNADPSRVKAIIRAMADALRSPETDA